MHTFSLKAATYNKEKIFGTDKKKDISNYQPMNTEY